MPHPIWRQHRVHPGASGSTIGVRRSHAPYRGLCGVVAAPAWSIPVLAGWGTARLQLRRPAPERYDLHLPPWRLESPLCLPPDPGLIPCPHQPFSQALSSSDPICSQAHNPDGWSEWTLSRGLLSFQAFPPSPCVLALLLQLWDVVPSARVFLFALHCSPVWPGAQCAAQGGFERTATSLL